MGGTDAVSVIIPVYNDPEGIETTLNSVTAQTYPAEHYEVLVVDNGSTDTTRSVAEQYASRHDTVTVLVEDEIQGSYAARNTGIRNANGDVLAFIDADMSVDADWLERATASMHERGCRYMGTNVEVYSRSDQPTLAERYQIAKGFPVKSYLSRDNFAPTCCLFVSRALFDEIGLFDESVISGGDYEFGNRAVKHGVELHYEPDITVYHPARTTFRELCRKQRRVGTGKAQLHDSAPELTGPVFHPRHLLPTTPWHFLDQFAADYEPTRSELFVFYLLDYLFKIRRSIAMVSEWAG